MDLFLRDRSSGEWRLSAHLLSGLKVAAEESMEVVLRSDDPVDDLGEIVACAWLFKLAGGDADKLSLISPCPSLGWIDPVRKAGVSRLFTQPRCPQRRFSRDELIEVPRWICPQLHVRRYRGAAMSVCGRRSDLVVLATHHFQSRCFSGWATCREASR
jgi:hypothetical protein